MSPEFQAKSAPVINPSPTTAPITQPKTRLIIGGTNKKFDFSGKAPLKAFTNAYDKTIFAIEEQKFEDWVDAMDKIYKMLRKDFPGTVKKFFSFLINISKPVEKDDFETKMAKINAQRQQLEVDKMVKNLKDGTNNETLQIEQSKQQTLPTNIAKLPLINEKQKIKPFKTLIVLKPIDNDEISITTEDVDEEEFTEFQKVEQRLLSKLKDSGVGNYDLWLDLADLYLKNTAVQKASEIYTYVAKNAKDKNKQRAINSIIGLD
jgi:L-rhamnose mutarotase